MNSPGSDFDAFHVRSKSNRIAITESLFYIPP